jgi:rhamnosyl/mannosyltransferase
VYDRAAAIVGTNPRSAGASMVLRRYLPKYGVLPLGLDLNPFLSPNAKALAAADFFRKKHGHPLWLSVGRLTYYKGFEIALTALREVPGRLLLVGDGPLETKLKRLAAELGVGDRVTWLGQTHDDELVGAYHAADALWFPSVARSEGFGQVQVEAMASRCPVLNTDLAGSGVPWVSPHEETGLTVPVGNAPALATAARRLLGEPGLRERLAKAARQRAITEFDHRIMGERSMAIYERARLQRR